MKDFLCTWSISNMGIIRLLFDKSTKNRIVYLNYTVIDFTRLVTSSFLKVFLNFIF